MIRGIAVSLKLFLNLLNKHGIEHPEERTIRQQLSPRQNATTRSKSFFLRKNVNLRRIHRSTAARETTVPLTCVCISQRCMSQEALDTLLDEKGKQDVYSSSEHLAYSLVLMASLSYVHHSCMPVPHLVAAFPAVEIKNKQTNKQTNKQENKKTNKKLCSHV